MARLSTKDMKHQEHPNEPKKFAESTMKVVHDPNNVSLTLSIDMEQRIHHKIPNDFPPIHPSVVRGSGGAAASSNKDLKFN